MAFTNVNAAKKYNLGSIRLVAQFKSTATFVTAQPIDRNSLSSYSNMEISHPNYNNADDDTKAAWVAGFLDAFGRLAFQVNEEPYSAFVRGDPSLTVEETFHWCLSAHHPYSDDKFSWGTITPLADMMLTRTLKNEIYGWLYRFLGFRRPTQRFGKPDLYFDDGLTDAKSTFFISHENAFREKIVDELVDTIRAITNPDSSTLMVTAWGCYFHMRAKESDWILVLTCGG